MKKTLFAIYLSYLRNFPNPLGKGFLSRLIRRLGFAIYEIDGVRLELNPSAWIDRDLVSGKAHDAFVQQTIMDALSNGGVFVDIGANIGVFTLAASMMRDVRVFAFEPSPRELARLYRNLALNQVSNVVVFPFALGRTSTRMELSLGGDDNPGHNTFVAEVQERGPRQSAVCHCEPFDGLLKSDTLKQIRVVKIDVEGFEMEVLRGMSASITVMERVTFVVEVTRSLLQCAGSSAEELYAFFDEHGFSPEIGLQEHDLWNEGFSRKP
ncbi:MAG: FkbM family methyltransferase [Chthoniobacteraceae bacterium]